MIKTAGKTTLLRLIAGLEEPTEGRVFFDGVDVTESRVQDRDLGVVFQVGAPCNALVRSRGGVPVGPVVLLCSSRGGLPGVHGSQGRCCAVGWVAGCCVAGCWGSAAW